MSRPTRGSPLSRPAGATIHTRNGLIMTVRKREVEVAKDRLPDLAGASAEGLDEAGELVQSAPFPDLSVPVPEKAGAGAGAF
jgi:hypothetical protein